VASGCDFCQFMAWKDFFYPKKINIMKSKKSKKNIQNVRSEVPEGQIKPQSSAEIVGGNNPWVNYP
jgi:hypothetical protein